ncbi:MAG: 50S ribosomal protein L39e [Nitrososphaeria archaeon]|mgnify:FL=1|nr:50S ribosomal protein L39e [Nitrososphaeria archaeon]
MGSIKSKGLKRRLLVEYSKAQGVPTWVVLKTKMKVRSNPQRRHWRRNKLKL